MDAPYGRLEQLEPGIARLLAHNPSPFTFTGTQTYLVGDREVGVIDPGPDDAGHLASLQAAIAGRPVAAILVTHTHRDHSPAAGPLSRLTGAPIMGCAPLALEAVGPRADAAFDGEYQPDRELADGDSIIIDGHDLGAVATPGHTSNHLCFAYRGALFTGDHVMGWSTTVVIPPDGDMADYMASLQKLQEREDRIYYPAHGPAVDRPQQLVRGMLGHRMQRERQILRILREGDARAIPEIVGESYPGLNPKLLTAAGGTVLAHLLDLERRGLVGRYDATSGEAWHVR